MDCGKRKTYRVKLYSIKSIKIKVIVFVHYVAGDNGLRIIAYVMEDEFLAI